jgi:hypothetical protein
MAIVAGDAVARHWEQRDDDSGIAAVLLERDGHEAGYINTRLVLEDALPRVHDWADRARGRGRRCSILYAEDLASLDP